MIGQIETEIGSRAFRAANELKSAAEEVLRGQRTGKVYRKPTGGTYTASAPGEPPAVRTDQLRTKFRVVIDSSKNPAIENAPASKYAALLDEGTPGGRIQPRPFKDRIIEIADPKVKAIFDEPYHIM